VWPFSISSCRRKALAHKEFLGFLLGPEHPDPTQQEVGAADEVVVRKKVDGVCFW
jgi:hypothetical protein